MSFSFIWFLLKIFSTKSLSHSPSLLLLIHFIFLLKQRRTCYKFCELPTSFYHLSPCGYDLHSRYCYHGVLREAKTHTSTFPNFLHFLGLIFARSKFWRRYWGWERFIHKVINIFFSVFCAGDFLQDITTTEDTFPL